MSRTPKRGKPPGYEYWSKRTHRNERVQAKKAIAEQSKESADGE